MVLVISGNPAVKYFYMPAVIILPFVLLAARAIYLNVGFKRSDLLIVTAFSTISLIHLSIFGFQVISPSGSFLFTIFTALLIVRVVPDFGRRIVWLMFFLSIISLLFYIPTIFGVDMAALFRPISIPFEQNNIQPSVHIGIHNYRMELGGLNRNSGMFWEPGAFAGYIIFSMLFLFNAKDRLSSIMLIVMSITILTTQSTTGYIALFIYVTGFLWNRARSFSSISKRVVRIVITLFMIFGALLAYSNLPFLQAKIVHQITNAEELGSGWQITRLGNAIYDLEYMKERPLFGWSLSNGTRGEADEDILERQGNGLTGAAVRIGIIGLLIYLTTTFNAIRKYFDNNYIAAYVTIIIITLLIGEQFILYPLFLTLMFLPRYIGRDFPRTRHIGDTLPLLGHPINRLA